MVTDYPIHVALQFMREDVKNIDKRARDLVDALYKMEFAKYSSRVPRDLMDEMHGIVAGANHPDVTIERVFALNFAVDLMLAIVYDPQQLVKFLGKEFAALLRIPDMCNVRMEGDYYARDFQFPNGNVFNDVAMIMIRHIPGRNVTACQAAPGLIGGTSVFNCCGMAFGVNLIRSTESDVSRVAMSAPVRLRWLAEQYRDVDDAVTDILHAERGCPWLYSLMDAHGKMVVMETTAFNAAVRGPDEFAAGRNGDVTFRSWWHEQSYKAEHGNRYVPTIAATGRYALVVTNFALTLEMRARQGMSKHVNELEAGSSAPVYRYNVFAKQESMKSMTDAKRVASALSPKYEPGLYEMAYPEQRDVPDEDKVIEGSLVVWDVRNRKGAFKVDRWSSEWIPFRIEPS